MAKRKRKTIIKQSAKERTKSIIDYFNKGNISQGCSLADVLRRSLNNHLDELEQAITDIALAITDEETDMENRKKAVNKIIRVKPVSFNGYGAILLQFNQYKKAIEAFEIALSTARNREEVLINYGIALMELEQFEKAVEKFDEALEVAPENVTVISNYGFALFKMGKHEEATKKFEQSFEKSSDDALTLQKYGLTQALLGQYETTVERYEQALPDRGKDIDQLLFNYGAVLVHAGKYQDAIQKYERILQLIEEETNIDLPEEIDVIHIHLGLVHYRLQSHEEAQKYFDTVIKQAHESDRESLQKINTIFAANPHGKEGVDILQELMRDSARYYQSFEYLILYDSAKQYWEMFRKQLEQE
ncbi:MAG: hypothetical protein B6242_15080 [Anaerolineaceae bacterium 4572_78]|nr:MAG: hypothetical protein B6242_15080 [Anaerolineaceae bacterium 4572_78]